MFPEMLDPARRSMVMAAPDPAMREVLLDLATVQTFRRDLFAKGPSAPPLPGAVPSSPRSPCTSVSPG